MSVNFLDMSGRSFDRELSFIVVLLCIVVCGVWLVREGSPAISKSGSFSRSPRFDVAPADSVSHLLHTERHSCFLFDTKNDGLRGVVHVVTAQARRAFNFAKHSRMCTAIEPRRRVSTFRQESSSSGVAHRAVGRATRS